MTPKTVEMTIPECALALNISETHVKELVANHVLRIVREGKHSKYICAAELVRYVLKNQPQLHRHACAIISKAARQRLIEQTGHAPSQSRNY